MAHYLMIAKLSNRCFELVKKILERSTDKVTQGDFIDLYEKTEEEKYHHLLDLSEERKTFRELRKQRIRTFRLCLPKYVTPYRIPELVS